MPTSRTLVFGLGNPGEEYRESRHNTGFLVLEALRERLNLNFRKPLLKRYRIAEGGSFALIEPLTYMNNSGSIFPSLVHDGDSIIVVLDQMDLEVGRVKIKSGGGSAGHNGLKSIIENIGEDFVRIYVGIGRPLEGESTVDHVLGKFTQDERELLKPAIDRAVSGILDILDGVSLERVKQSVNTERP